jgi:hypothetical protein
MNTTDLSRIAPCGGCCDDCDFYISSACKEVIEINLVIT